MSYLTKAGQNITKKNKAEGNQTEDKQKETADVPEGGVKIEGKNVQEDDEAQGSAVDIVMNEEKDAVKEAPSRMKKGKDTNQGTEETPNMEQRPGEIEEETRNGKREEEIKTDEAENEVDLEFFNFEDFEVVDELVDDEEGEKEEKKKNEAENRNKDKSSSRRQRGRSKSPSRRDRSHHYSSSRSSRQHHSSHSGHSRDRVRDRYDDKERNGRSSRTSSRHYESSRKHERRDDYTSGDKHRERRKGTEKDRTPTKKRPREDEVKSSKRTKTTDHKQTSRKETSANKETDTKTQRKKSDTSPSTIVIQKTQPAGSNTSIPNVTTKKRKTDAQEADKDNSAPVSNESLSCEVMDVEIIKGTKNESVMEKVANVELEADNGAPKTNENTTETVNIENVPEFTDKEQEIKEILNSNENCELQVVNEDSKNMENEEITLIPTEPELSEKKELKTSEEPGINSAGLKTSSKELGPQINESICIEKLEEPQQRDSKVNDKELKSLKETETVQESSESCMKTEPVQDKAESKTTTPTLSTKILEPKKGARVVLKRMKEIKTNVQDDKNMETSVQSNIDDKKTGVGTRTRSSARNATLAPPQRITRSQNKIVKTPPVCKGKKETSSKAVKKIQEQVKQIKTYKEFNQVKEVKSESICEESQTCDASKSTRSEVMNEDDVINTTVKEVVKDEEKESKDIKMNTSPTEQSEVNKDREDENLRHNIPENIKQEDRGSEAKENHELKTETIPENIKQEEEDRCSEAKEKPELKTETILENIKQEEEDRCSEAKEKHELKTETILENIKQEEEERCSEAKEKHELKTETILDITDAKNIEENKCQTTTMEEEGKVWTNEQENCQDVTQDKDKKEQEDKCTDTPGKDGGSDCIQQGQYGNSHIDDHGEPIKANNDLEENHNQEDLESERILMQLEEEFAKEKRIAATAGISDSDSKKKEEMTYKEIPKVVTDTKQKVTETWMMKEVIKQCESKEVRRYSKVVVVSDGRMSLITSPDIKQQLREVSQIITVPNLNLNDVVEVVKRKVVKKEEECPRGILVLCLAGLHGTLVDCQVPDACRAAGHSDMVEMVPLTKNEKFPKLLSRVKKELRKALGKGSNVIFFPLLPVDLSNYNAIAAKHHFDATGHKLQYLPHTGNFEYQLLQDYKKAVEEVNGQSFIARLVRFEFGSRLSCSKFTDELLQDGYIPTLDMAERMIVPQLQRSASKLNALRFQKVVLVGDARLGQVVRMQQQEGVEPCIFIPQENPGLKSLTRNSFPIKQISSLHNALVFLSVTLSDLVVPMKDLKENNGCFLPHDPSKAFDNYVREAERVDKILHSVVQNCTIIITPLMPFDNHIIMEYKRRKSLKCDLCMKTKQSLIFALEQVSKTLHIKNDLSPWNLEQELKKDKSVSSSSPYISRLSSRVVEKAATSWEEFLSRAQASKRAVQPISITSVLQDYNLWCTILSKSKETSRSQRSYSKDKKQDQSRHSKDRTSTRSSRDTEKTSTKSSDRTKGYDSYRTKERPSSHDSQKSHSKFKEQTVKSSNKKKEHKDNPNNDKDKTQTKNKDTRTKKIADIKRSTSTIPTVVDLTSPASSPAKQKNEDLDSVSTGVLSVSPGHSNINSPENFVETSHEESSQENPIKVHSKPVPLIRTLHPWKQSSWKGFPESTQTVDTRGTPPATPFPLQNQGIMPNSINQGIMPNPISQGIMPNPINQEIMPNPINQGIMPNPINQGIMPNPIPHQQINYLSPVKIHQTGHTYTNPDLQVGWDRNIDTDISRSREKLPMVRGRSKSRSLSPKRMHFTRSRSGSQDRLLISPERKAMHRWAPRKSLSPLQGYRLFLEGTSFQHGRRSTSRSKRSYSRDRRSVSRGRRSISRGRSISKGRNLGRRSISRGRRSVSIGRSIPRNRSISRERRSISRGRSLSRGRRSISRGRRSISRGRRSISRGRRSISRGRRSISRGRRSISRGRRSISRGRRSISRGRRSISRGRRSISRGRRSVPREKRSISRGRRSISRGRRSLSRGRRSISRGRRSLSRGRRSVSRGRRSTSRNRRSPFYASSTQQKRNEFKVDEALKTLRLLHDNECEKYRSNPTIHPDLGAEYRRFCEQKTQSILALGGDPSQYNMAEAWHSFWIKRMEEIFLEQWKAKKNQCLAMLDSYKNPVSIQPSVRTHRSSSVISSSDMSISEDSEESEPRRSKVRKRRKKSSPVKSTKVKTSDKRDMEIERSPINSQLPQTGVRKETDYILTKLPDMIKEVRQEENIQSSMIREVRQEEWEKHISKSQEMTQTIKDAWEPKTKQQDSQPVAMAHWDKNKRSDPHGIEEDNWLISSKKSVLKSSKSPETTVQEPPLKQRSWHKLDSKHEEIGQSTNIDDQCSSGISEIFKSFAMNKPSQTKELDSHYKRNPTGDESQDKPIVKDYHHKSEGITQMFQTFAAKIGDKSAIAERTRDTPKSLPSTQMSENYPTKTSDTALKHEGSMDSSKSLPSTQMFKSYGTMASDTARKPETSRDTSKTLPSPMASKESTKIDVVNVLEVLIHLGDKLGALCDPLKVVLERTKKLESNGADPMVITNDRDSKLLLRMVQDKLQGILKDDKLNIIKKVIIQEAEQRLSLLLDLHEERSLTGNLSLTQLARHCLSMDDSATMDFIRTVLKCQGHADVSEQQLMKLYVMVKEEQLKLLRDRHNKAVANTSLSSTDNLHHQNQKTPYPPLISKVMGDSVNSLESKSASLFPMSQTESQSSTGLYNSLVSRIMEQSRNQPQATHNNSDLDPGRQWETPSYSQATVTDGRHRSNWPTTMKSSMVFQPSQHSVLSNWSLESQNVVSHPKASTSSLGDPAQNMLTFSQKPSKYVRKKPICMTLPKQQPQKTIMGTYNPLGDYDTENEELE